MADSIQKLKIQYLRSHKRLKRWKTTMIALCSVIALSTGYVLINPAQGQEQATYCGMEEHTEHTEECYEKLLTCMIPESGHTHGDDCYEETDVYICGLEETEGHTHTESCYGPVTKLVCGLEETEGHTHTAGCYQEIRTLSCGQEECAGHTHTDSCYEQQPVLICTNTDPEHVHTKECYISEPVLVCGMEERAGHTHSDDCCTVSQELICGLEECDPHTHTDSCYGETTGLVCGLEECAPHTHDETCIQKEKQLVCTLEECEGHKHTEECYSQETVLVCEKPLHIHTLQCFSNPDADLESEAVWNQLVSGVQLSGIWADDLIAVARTQLGYAESSANYLVLEDGVSINGYSRYGAWYGMPYGDWCAMFCSFCMHYAGIDSEFFPYDMTCDTWITALQNRVSSKGGSMFRYSRYYSGGAYAGSGEAYGPVKGDLVFFDTNGDAIADHVGIIYEVSEDGQSIATIEGNLADTVGCGSYHVSDAAIVGYGLLPENPCPCKDCYDKYGARLCGEDCTCVCHTEQDNAEETGNDTSEDNKEGETEDKGGEVEPVSVYEERNGITVTVTGNLPEEAMLLLSEVPEDQLQAILKEAGGDTSVFAYDITILDKDGTVWQPDELGAVVSITGLNVSEEEDLKVVHVPDEEEAVPEQLEAETTEGKIEFTAESFSVYVVYTVDFHYEDLTYSISGGGSVLLSGIFAELDIPENIADVSDVTFSDPELLIAAKTEDGTDWILTSYAPFSTKETLTVTFIGGRILSIAVTDAGETAASGSYSDTITVPELNPTSGKYIDYLGDGIDNPDTDLDESGTNLDNIYRLYLEVGTGTKYDGVDVLFVLDASNSMCTTNGDGAADATDILGKTGCWRNWALETLMNGETAADMNSYSSSASGTSAKHQSTVYTSSAVGSDGKIGLIETIEQLNPNNKIAVISFNSTAKTLVSWTNASDLTELSLSNNTGTNYEAGLNLAGSLLSSSDTVSSHRKIMIFISDGSPNQGTTDAAGFRSTYGGSTDIYSIGVGSVSKINWTYLQDLTNQGLPASSTDFGTLLTSLENAIKASVVSYSDITITDTLSDYVDLYTDDVDFLVQMIVNGSATDLYKDGALTTEGAKYIKSDGVTYSGKTVKVEFLNNFVLPGNTTFRVSFNVKTTKTAYETLTATGYSNTGDSGTDYSGNTSSSGKSGFYSNASATLTYTSTLLGDTTGTKKTLTYSKPVVQALPESDPEPEYGYQLPETGGTGPEIYLFAGIAAIGTAIVFSYITYKRKRNYYHENY